MKPKSSRGTEHRKRHHNSKSQRRGTYSSRIIPDPPYSAMKPYAGKEIHSSDENHRSRNRAQKGNMSSNTKKRRSFRGTHAKNEQDCDHRDIDSISATLSTVSCTTDDSSCFNAEESKDDRNDKRSIATASMHNTEYGPDDAENEDGYDTDNAVVYDTTSLCSTKKDVMPITQDRHEQPLDHQSQQKVQQIVEQLLHEQSMAREAWDEVATEYHQRIEPFTSLFVPHLLDHKHLGSSSFNNEYHYLSGKSVLDVAAGTGAGALYAASRGASSVMATDFSENMLRVLQSRIDAYHFHNLEAQIANGLCLPLSWANKYDVVFSNFGVIYFPKVKEGLWEMVRCTKHGGKVCISGWGSKEETHAFSIFPAAMKRCGGLDRTWYRAQSAARKRALAGTVPLSSRKQHQRRRKYHGISLAPNYFCPAPRIASSQYSLHSMMTEAGLDNVQVIPVTKDLRLDSAESYWTRFVLGSPNLKRFVEHCLNPEEVMQLKDAVSDIIREESSSHRADGVALKASAYIAIGTKT
jgi:ubiquinone/menaquinone biosynthesis C-methylase UbiE